MDFKLNQGQIDQSSNRRRNNIFRRFRKQLYTLLSFTRNRQQYPELNKVYIKNEAVHLQLDDFYNDKQNIGQ